MLSTPRQEQQEPPPCLTHQEVGQNQRLTRGQEESMFLVTAKPVLALAIARKKNKLQADTIFVIQQQNMFACVDSAL